MENIKMALVTDDRDYGRALGMGILSVCRSMIIRIFTGDEYAALTEDEGDRSSFASMFDIILRDAPPADDGTGSLFLSERPGEGDLYKYGPVRRLAAEVMEVHRERTGSSPVMMTGDGARILTFASWCGGTGCSTIAMSVAEEIARYYGRRVLYVTLEESESTASFMETEDCSRNAGRYIYHLLKDRDDPPSTEGYTVRSDHGVEAFAPSRGRNPLRMVSRDEFSIFLSSLSEGGRYDFIVVDSGTSMDDVSLAAMEMSERICLVSARDGNTAREARFIGHLICRCGERLMDRSVKVVNMDGGEGGEEKDPIAPADMFISKSRYFTDGNMSRRIFLEGEFGRDISRLTETLIDFRQS